MWHALGLSRLNPLQLQSDLTCFVVLQAQDLAQFLSPKPWKLFQGKGPGVNLNSHLKHLHHLLDLTRRWSQSSRRCSSWVLEQVPDPAHEEDAPNGVASDAATIVLAKHPEPENPELDNPELEEQQ